MARKRNCHSVPRRKRMKRRGRLSSARATGWVEEYKGRNIIAGYSKWFAVDLLCALVELRLPCRGGQRLAARPVEGIDGGNTVGTD
jgi:hypothetical protein